LPLEQGSSPVKFIEHALKLVDVARGGTAQTSVDPVG